MRDLAQTGYIGYKDIAFKPESLALIDQVNGIISEYAKKGYSLTLRQVYYQLVSRNVIANKERSYKNLGNLISDARLAGYISWYAIEDRTRNLRQNGHWDSPAEIIRESASIFYRDRWEDQDTYVEVWVEKDALVGVVGRACSDLDVPYFSCRGYVSQSEMWVASQRLIAQGRKGKDLLLLHLGDHDPSGRDMSRDIEERLTMFGANIEFRRIALNMDQIDEYDPPENPAKVTDSRARTYIEEFGDSSWELDALRPEVIEGLIRDHVTACIDQDELREVERRERREKALLERVADDWNRIESDYEEEDGDEDDDD